MRKVYKSQFIFIVASLVVLNAAISIAAQKVETTPPTRADARSSPASAFAFLQLCNASSARINQTEIAKNPAARKGLLAGQTPYVAIVGCSDSRVPLETVIASNPGDIFAVRIAGNVVSDDAIGSLEYAVKYLGVPLIVVLGHEHCGAVHASLHEKEVAGSLPQLLGKIRPAVQSATRSCVGCSDEALLSACIAANAKLGMDELLNRSTTIRSYVDQGKVALACGVIDLTDASIKWIVSPAAK